MNKNDNMKRRMKNADRVKNKANGLLAIALAAVLAG